MPTVGVYRDVLYAQLGTTYTEKEFEELCFQFGLELDDVTSERQMLEKEQAGAADLASQLAAASTETIYKIDVPANRYDLLCAEGLSRGLKIFLGREPVPAYRLSGQCTETLTVTANTQAVRPFCVAAVLRNITFDADRYKNFIDLQEKLHENICRKRTLVAIGTHDLDTISGPFTYDARAPQDIKFKPLRAKNMDKEYRADELVAEYKTDLQLKEYVPIIEKEPLYPVIVDSNNTVLSMPPIINGHHSKIHLGTKNVFIECTATDLTKARVVLNILVCMFSEYCQEQFVVEPVNVVNADGSTVQYPTLDYRTEHITAEAIYRRTGMTEKKTDTAALAKLLTQMQLTSTVAADGKSLDVVIPPTRADIIHACDICEDAAIAYGYNNIEWTQPKVVSVGKHLPINKLSDQLRALVAQAEYREALTFSLCERVDNFEMLRRPDNGTTAVSVSDPNSRKCEQARCNLLAGLVHTVAANKSVSLPLKVFEISDVVLQDPAAETGATNRRRLGAVRYGTSAGFEDLLSLLEYVFKMLGIPRSPAAAKPDAPKCWTLTPSADPAFFGELGAADIIFQGTRVGVIGVLHPEVLKNFGLKNPAAAFELEVDPFL